MVSSANAGTEAWKHNAKVIREAKGEIALLGEETGVRLPRHLRGFVAELPGVGAALNAAFGATAVLMLSQIVTESGEKVAEFIERSREAGARVTESFAEITVAAQKSNDELQVSNDKLEVEISKLRGKPSNGVKLALDEAILAADNFAESLKRAYAEEDKLLKAEHIGGMKGFFGSITGGSSSTGHAEEVIKEYQKKMQEAAAEGRTMAALAKSDDEARKVATETQIRLQGILTEAIDQTGKVYESYKEDQESVGGVNSEASQAMLLGAQREFIEQQRALQLEATHAKLEGEKQQEEASKAAAEAKKKQDEEQKKRDEEQKKRDEEALKLARLKLELANNGLGSIANSEGMEKMPSGAALENVNHILEEAKKAHTEVWKYIEDENKERFAAEARYYEKVIKDAEEAAKKANELREEQDLRAQNTREQGLGKVELQEIGVKGQAATGQINPQQELQQIAALDEQKLAIERVYIAQKLKVDADDEKAYLKDLNEQVKLEQKAAQQKLQVQIQLQQQEQKRFQQYYTTLTSAINQETMQWISGHQKFGIAAEQVWNHLASNAIQNLMKITEQYVAGELVHRTMAQKGVMVDAKKAATGAYSAVSSIPIIGPIIAPIAAAAAFAGVMAIGTFEEGGVVPKTQVALVHGGERVLDESDNRSFERAIAAGKNMGNAPSSRGGAFQPSFAPRISALDGASVDRVLRKHEEKFFKQAARIATRRNLGRLK